MGYHIRTLRNLPDTFQKYFFLIGNYEINDLVSGILIDEFERIADDIGENSAIIKNKNNDQYEYEIIEELLKIKDRNVKTVVEKFSRTDPGLLIMDCHPRHFSEKSMLIYIPFRNIDKIYKQKTEFYNDLIRFNENKDNLLIKKIENANSIFRKIGGILDLKPNFFGMGINLNKIFGFES